MLRRASGGAVMVLFLVPSLICAREGKENIALGKVYKLHQKPNYALCTDPGDYEQITDGKYTEGHFWTQKSTVGWQNTSPVTVTIDLGDIAPICGVLYSTAAGVAGVEWPSAIYISVSDDGKKFYEAGELVSISSKDGQNVPPPTGEYHTHMLWTNQLKTHGRFVSFIIFGEPYIEPYIFVDEIEVYKGKPEFLKIPFAGTAFSDGGAHFKTRFTRQNLGEKLYKAVNTIRETLRQTLHLQSIRKKCLTNWILLSVRYLLPLLKMKSIL